ncbi:MAG: leucine-rich repeat protein, partial [Coriobacteriales bacterium]|nr:leucine-rich repeat protein [Coriobacteriales bacterium]
RDGFALQIPDSVEKDGRTYSVVAIADKACGGSSSLDFVGSLANTSKRKVTSVSIPASVTTIGVNSFGSNVLDMDMKQLVSVEFADGSQLSSIGKQAFYGTGITQIVFPENLESIGDAAFRDSMLTEITFLTHDASMPTWRTANSSLNSFRNVKNVQAHGYASATAARANVEAMDAISGYSWTWNEMEEPQPQGLWGDADGSGVVNSRDALYVIRYATGRLGADGLDLAVCDVDGSGEVNSRDALYIIRYSSGRIDSFPVQKVV